MSNIKDIKDVKVAKTVIKSSFPAFTVAALTLLILKLCGFGFSWLWIPLVWLFPLWLLLGIILFIIAIVLAVGIPVGIVVLIVLLCKKI
jgi:hypothetical protein